MNTNQMKAMRLATRIKKQIFSHLDENDFHRALGTRLDRWNNVQRVAFPGESVKSPGYMLNPLVRNPRF